MSRRRATFTPTPTRTEPDDLPVSARVAWSYLAAFAAMVISAGVVVLANQAAAPLICRDPANGAIADCKVGLAIWVGLGAFLIALIPVALKAHLDLWLVAALWAELGLWVAFDALDQWWWWAMALLTPAGAALLTARWGASAAVARAQRVAVVVLLAAAVAALIWWYLRG